MDWKHEGASRPGFAQAPEAGQESVWDYPRPPRIEPDGRRVVVRSFELVIAQTSRALRVLETASPPTFYLPREDVRMELLQASRQRTYCEWKGEATYYDLDAPWGSSSTVAWSYLEPRPPFAELAGYLAFYPSRVECFVGGERVKPQPGGFYGGWMTAEIVGPVKGEPGTEGW
jgi:uncharacterized protein (DUF427 family)